MGQVYRDPYRTPHASTRAYPVQIVFSVAHADAPSMLPRKTMLHAKLLPALPMQNHHVILIMQLIHVIPFWPKTSLSCSPAHSLLISPQYPLAHTDFQVASHLSRRYPGSTVQ